MTKTGKSNSVWIYQFILKCGTSPALGGTMDQISTCRAAYLIPFIEVLRDIGTPVERELEAAMLPMMVEETPDDTVSNILADKFVASCERHEGLDDLGWLWAKQFSSSAFSDELLAALKPLPTVTARLDRFAELSCLEDSDVRVGVIQFNGSSEVFCDITPPDGLEGIHISEWTQIMVLIAIIRSVTGNTWSPDEIRFKTDFNVCDAAREANPNTRFLKGSLHTSVVVPTSVMAASTPTGGGKVPPNQMVGAVPDDIETLKRLLRPYLREATPKIDFFAEITGTSSRSLQRKLQNAGVSYSELIESTRFELAAEMLEDPDIQLIDVAMTLGFENQSNFGRSFRRIAGISPGKFRRQMLLQKCAA